jgi:hypothetical protein
MDRLRAGESRPGPTSAAFSLGVFVLGSFRCLVAGAQYPPVRWSPEERLSGAALDKVGLGQRRSRRRWSAQRSSIGTRQSAGRGVVCVSKHSIWPIRNGTEGTEGERRLFELLAEGVERGCSPGF